MYLIIIIMITKNSVKPHKWSSCISSHAKKKADQTRDFYFHLLQRKQSVEIQQINTS